MTTDNAIAVLRRMQEPDPFEPQITQTAFDALEMAIDMIERYSTWSQTYSNMVEDTIYRRGAIDLLKKWADGYKYIETETELAIRDFQHLPSAKMVEDTISRKAAIDVIHKYFAERIEQLPTHMTEDGEVYDLEICNPLLADNKALSQAIKELPSAQPTEASCWGCNCPKMERLKVQKTFSEMVHLHDAEQQWIPCSETEDLPKHEVLCCDKYGEELIGWLSCEDDQWLCESDGEMMYDPIAWRELPDPWKGEQP